MADPCIKIFTGNANPQLAQQIASFLRLPLGQARVVRFADGEIAVHINESVRSCNTFVIQPLCPPANESMMESLIMIDALKRASAHEIVAVVPYYAYARQDRKTAPREPITAKLVANLFQTAGATRIIAMDLHAGQIQGFFDIPVDHLLALPVFLQDLKQQFQNISPNDIVVVSPDAGGVERARAYAKHLQTSLAIVDKRRPRPNVAEIMSIIGNAQNKHAVIIDDMIDTAGTLVLSAEALLAQGAKSVRAYATHPVFSGTALKRIADSQLHEVVVSNTIPLKEESPKIRVLSCASLIGEAMKRIHTGISISSLFTDSSDKL